jgi:hypothetical protein
MNLFGIPQEPNFHNWARRRKAGRKPKDWRAKKRARREMAAESRRINRRRAG